MKYALKINSRHIKNDWRAGRHGIPTGKLYFLEDEKAVFNFLRFQMKKDLLDPIGGTLSWSKAETVSPSEILGIYSYLCSAKDIDFHFLCWSARVRKYLLNQAGMKGYMYDKLSRLRSMPFNYTIYKLKPDVAGTSILQAMSWNSFILQSLKDSTITKDDLKYVAD